MTAQIYDEESTLSPEADVLGDVLFIASPFVESLPDTYVLMYTYYILYVE